jgi:hypothetical protein
VHLKIRTPNFREVLCTPASALLMRLTCEPEVWPALLFLSWLQAWCVFCCMLAGVKDIHLC